MTVSTLRPASSASTASSWPGRKSSKPKISFKISCFELRLAPSRFIKLVPELGSRLRGLPPEPEGLKGGGQGGHRPTSIRVHQRPNWTGFRASSKNFDEIESG